MNLIGEHTDYNGGFVMPCAIAYETRVAARVRNDRAVTVRSGSADARFDLGALSAQRLRDWRDYPRGILLELQAEGIELPGFDAEVTHTVPIGAGLSSSASFEIAFALAAVALSGFEIAPLRLAQIAQRAESRHAGTRCGIMDQCAAVFGRAGKALFLDTRTLEFEALAVPDDLAIVICNTMVKHALAAGAYNERRSECEAAAAALRASDPQIRELRDVTLQQLLERRSDVPPPLYDRALHVVTENGRVQAAAAALRERDAPRFGALMNESHASLRDRFAVSCAELDDMAALARALPGVYGARMTGGGFGGCTVNAVARGHAAEFRERIVSAYRAKYGVTPETYDGTPAAGASVECE